MLGLLLAAGLLGAGALPVHTWHTAGLASAAPSLASYLVGVLNKLGLYVLARALLTTAAGPTDTQALIVVAGLGALTALAGGVAALTQWSLQRVVAALTVAHTGLAVLAMGAGSSLGLGGGLALVVAQTFGLAAIVLSLYLLWHRTDAKAGWRAQPIALIGYVIGALVLVGVPPWPGFVGQALAYRALLSPGNEWGAVLVLAGIMSALMMALALARLGLREFVSRNARQPVHLWRADALSRVTVAALVVVGLVLALLPGLWLSSLVGPASGLTFAGSWGGIGVVVGAGGRVDDIWPAWLTLLLLAAAMGLGLATLRALGEPGAEAPAARDLQRLGRRLEALAVDEAAFPKTRVGRALAVAADALGNGSLDPYLVLRRVVMLGARGAAYLMRLTLRLLLR
jgi:formate hydrogenlyase subunit 3/multisubunit Na+/H+ antiporter MnhD subunit